MLDTIVVTGNGKFNSVNGTLDLVTSGPGAQSDLNNKVNKKITLPANPGPGYKQQV